MTTGTFTPDAKREATRDGAPAIDLIDGDQLCDLLKDLKLGVRTEMVEQSISSKVGLTICDLQVARAAVATFVGR